MTEYIKWSKLQDPDKWPENPLGEPIMVCKTPEEAQTIAKILNQMLDNTFS